MFYANFYALSVTLCNYYFFAIFWKSEGEIPVIFLNVTAKFDLDLKPNPVDIASIVRLPYCSGSPSLRQASFTLASFTSRRKFF